MNAIADADDDPLGDFRLLSRQQVAGLMGISTGMLDTLISEGELPCVCVRRRKMVRAADYVSFINRNTIYSKR